MASLKLPYQIGMQNLAAVVERAVARRGGCFVGCHENLSGKECPR